MAREPRAFVSTGTLPGADDVESLVGDAHRRNRAVSDGDVSSVYPALERAAAGLFGICVAGVTGRLFAAGNSVRGQLVARLLSASLGLDLFVSSPAAPAPD